MKKKKKKEEEERQSWSQFPRLVKGNVWPKFNFHPLSTRYFIVISLQYSHKFHTAGVSAPVSALCECLTSWFYDEWLQSQSRWPLDYRGHNLQTSRQATGNKDRAKAPAAPSLLFYLKTRGACVGAAGAVPAADAPRGSSYHSCSAWWIVCGSMSPAGERGPSLWLKVFSKFISGDKLLRLSAFVCVTAVTCP